MIRRGGDSAMTGAPAWLAPGDAATLIWYEASERRPDGVRVYQVAGPVLERVPPSPYFLLAPLEQEQFAARVYTGGATLADLRDFLGRCVIGEGGMADVLDLVFTRAEAPALPILDAWRELPDRPLAPYEHDVDAFVYDGGLVRVSPEAYRSAQSAGESFATASVCPGCGEAEDEGVFFWTLDRDTRVRVCLLIQNEGGRWTCVLRPFDFERAAVTA